MRWLHVDLWIYLYFFSSFQNQRRTFMYVAINKFLSRLVFFSSPFHVFAVFPLLLRLWSPNGLLFIFPVSSIRIRVPHWKSSATFFLLNTQIYFRVLSNFSGRLPLPFTFRWFGRKCPRVAKTFDANILNLIWHPIAKIKFWNIFSRTFGCLRLFALLDIEKRFIVNL